MNPEQAELQQLLESRFPIIIVEAAEERRFLQMIEAVATLTTTPLYAWSVVH